MNDEVRRKQIETIKAEFTAFKKSDLADALEERGVKTSGREKKDELLEMLAAIVLDSSKAELMETGDKKPAKNEDDLLAENLPSEQESSKTEATGREDAKKPAEPKKAAKSKRSRGGKVREITKKRRENVKELKKALENAEENSASEAKLYMEEEPELIPVDAAPKKPERKSPAHLKQEDIDLLESMNDPSKILTGRMEYSYVDRKVMWRDKVHPKTGETIRCFQMAAAVRYKSRIVYIPAEFFLDNYYDLEQKHMKRFIENRVGADVDFRVIQANTENAEHPIYIGSRIDAMAYKRKEYWYSDRDIGKSLDVGQIHEAKISAVGEGLVFVELYGVETAITHKHVSYTKHVSRSEDGKDDGLKAIYFPGETEKVMIKEIAKADDRRAQSLGYPVRCVMSIREAKEDTRDIYFVQDMGGMLFRGVINDITANETGKIQYFVEMNGHLPLKEDPKKQENLTIVCVRAEKCKVPRLGSVVSGRITFVNDRQKRAFGTIYHIDRI